MISKNYILISKNYKMSTTRSVFLHPELIPEIDTMILVHLDIEVLLGLYSTIPHFKFILDSPNVIVYFCKIWRIHTKCRNFNQYYCEYILKWKNGGNYFREQFVMETALRNDDLEAFIHNNITIDSMRTLYCNPTANKIITYLRQKPININFFTGFDGLDSLIPDSTEIFYGILLSKQVDNAIDYLNSFYAGLNHNVRGYIKSYLNTVITNKTSFEEALLYRDKCRNFRFFNNNDLHLNLLLSKVFIWKDNPECLCRALQKQYISIQECQNIVEDDIISTLKIQKIIDYIPTLDIFSNNCLKTLIPPTYPHNWEIISGEYSAFELISSLREKCGEVSISSTLYNQITKAKDWKAIYYIRDNNIKITNDY